MLGWYTENYSENPAGSKLVLTRCELMQTLNQGSPGFSGGAAQLNAWSIREKSVVSETQHNVSNPNRFDTKHTILENLFMYESDVGNTALWRATENYDYKGAPRKDSLASKCEFTEQVSTVWLDRSAAVTEESCCMGSV